MNLEMPQLKCYKPLAKSVEQVAFCLKLVAYALKLHMLAKPVAQIMFVKF